MACSLYVHCKADFHVHTQWSMIPLSH